MALSVVVGFGWIFLSLTGITYGNPLRRNLRWYFLFLWCVVSIGMSRYWQVSIQASVLLHCWIMRSLDQRIIFASSPVRLNCLWITGCVTPVPTEGWSCRWLLMMLIIIGFSTWVSHAMLRVFSIAIIGHFYCIPLCHIHRRQTIVLLMVWQRLCCWLGPPWYSHVGGISAKTTFPALRAMWHLSHRIWFNPVSSRTS